VSSILQRLGVRWRLLLAFFGISAFAVIAAAAAMYSFAEVGKLLARITEERVPPALASLELSRQAERVVTAAPAFLAATTRERHREVSTAIAAEVERLDRLLEDLKGSGIAPGALAAVEPAIDGLGRNLVAVDALVGSRLDVAERKAELLRKLSGTNIAAQRLVAPGVLVMDSKLAEWRRGIGEAGLDAGADGAPAGELVTEIAVFMPQQKAQIELLAIYDSLTKAAAAETPADLPLLAFPLRRSLAALETLAGEIEATLRPRLLEQIEAFRRFIDGPESLLAAREQELAITAQAEAVLAENVALSRAVGDALDRLVGNANRDIGAANQEALAAQRFGSSVLISMVLLSLVSSGLIVWLYVDRNLIARLTALSDSMLAIAGGNLRAPLPKPRDRDEIARMVEALAVFRDTALEVEENNLREVAQARQRLIDAIESISEGFAFYDGDDRLQLCNTRYKVLLYGGEDVDIQPGTPFETIVRRSVERGLIVEAGDDPEGYVQRRLATHRDPGPPTLQRRSDGRWVLISERRVGGGGTVAIYSDITTLKHRELALEEANQAIEQKHRELEALSSKLAKYLSPQVYQSIFAGRQEVSIASQRKKLTVFFSDITGFTETTDRLESEELTQLLNQYLTEMSRIALQHGATIDKYIGDGIMVFFGDPDSRGVKEDALACVTMAIAMQKRVRELASLWRDAGIERPLACRIGINTGYCTVGNFGSEDRMDYTIIGNAVNLASRLEHEAPPGSILISFETHALVKDEVRCEERGKIEVRGMPYPVATYEAIELYDELRDDEARRIREDRPSVRLHLDLDAMSDEERLAAAQLLRQALAQLVSPRPVPAGKRGGEAETREPDDRDASPDAA
jgi:adenylate cyclase